MSDSWFNLSKKQIILLAVYYTILMMIGMALTVYTLMLKLDIQTDTVMFNAIIGNVGSALIGATFFYIRKLYKLCINNEETKNQGYKRLGNFLYFFFRPIFGICSSILIVLMIRAGVLFVTIDKTQLDIKFIYLSMFISFFGGFAVGDLIDLLEDKGKNIFKNIIKT